MHFNLDCNDEWINGARIVCSPNFDDRPSGDIDLLVIHCISLPPRKYGSGFIDNFFTNCLDPKAHPYFSNICDLRVSAHLLINRKGLLTQYVSLQKRAWHAGDSAFGGKKRCNDFSIGIELEGFYDDKYCKVQYETLAKITNIICSRWNKITKNRIVAHSDISPNRKKDPGNQFDWQYYHHLIDSK